MSKTTITLRPDAALRLRALAFSVPYHEEMVRMYESFYRTNPLNGHRLWHEKLVKARQDLQRVKELPENTPSAQ